MAAKHFPDVIDELRLHKKEETNAVCARAGMEIEYQRERADSAEAAIDAIRDAVLHGRYQLAEMDIDSDTTNAVLDLIDDLDPRP